MDDQLKTFKRPSHDTGDDEQSLNVPRRTIKLSRCLVVSVCINDYQADTPFANRVGADKDVLNISRMFAGDHVYHIDGYVTAAKLESHLKWVQTEILRSGGKKYDGLVVVLSGHGIASKVEPSALSCFVTSDGETMHISDILHMFRNGAGALEDSFLGLPRIFVIEACRDAVAVAAADEHEEKIGGVVHKAFNQDDGFFIVRSSAAGSVSYRTKDDGSLLIKAVSQSFSFAATRARSFGVEDVMYLVKKEVAKLVQGKQQVIHESTLSRKVMVLSEYKRGDRKKPVDPSRVKPLPTHDLLEDGMSNFKWNGGDAINFFANSDSAQAKPFPIKSFHISKRSDRWVEGKDMLGVVMYLHKVSDTVEPFADPADSAEQQKPLPKSGEWSQCWSYPSGCRAQTGFIVLKSSDSLSNDSSLHGGSWHSQCYEAATGEQLSNSNVVAAGFAYQGGRWKWHSCTFNASGDGFHDGNYSLADGDTKTLEMDCIWQTVQKWIEGGCHVGWKLDVERQRLAVADMKKDDSTLWIK